MYSNRNYINRDLKVGGDKMFYGREKEIKSLEKRYKDGKFEFFVIRGRRRVGKSTLLREFCKQKNNTIFFTAQETSKNKNLELLSAEVNKFFSRGNVVYRNFQELFTDVFEASKKKRIVLVLDEFPYLANSDKSLMSMLQYLIDIYSENSKLFLILCGSSISFMEKKVLAYKAPLYGRSTGQMRIQPFMLKDAKNVYSNYSDVDKVIAYGVFGGVPAYLKFINNKKSIKQNIIDNLFDIDNLLYDEPNILLKEELREPYVYNSIIAAIATGYSKLNEISTKVGIESTKIAVYLKKLVELQIIKKEVPITSKLNTKKSIYSLNDNLFKFWYKFVLQNKTSIEFNEDKQMLYESIVKPYLEDYTGKIFEEVCKQYFLNNIASDKLPFVYEQIGRWWGTNKIEKREEEIDLIMCTNNKKKMFYIECKWRNEKVGINVLNELIKKAECFDKGIQKYYGICSKSGFKKEVIDYAKDNPNVYLYDLKQIVN